MNQVGQRRIALRIQRRKQFRWTGRVGRRDRTEDVTDMFAVKKLHSSWDALIPKEDLPLPLTISKDHGTALICGSNTFLSTRPARPLKGRAEHQGREKVTRPSPFSENHKLGATLGSEDSG